MTAYQNNPIHFFRQALVKLVLFSLAITVCLNVCRLRHFSGYFSFLPSLAVLFQSAALACLLTGVQVVFLSGKLIRTMPCLLRYGLTACCSLFVIAVGGTALNWFRVSWTVLLVLVPSYSFALFLGAQTSLWIQKHNLNGTSEIAAAIISNAKIRLYRIIAVLIIGMASGYRGNVETEKPWYVRGIVASELDERDSNEDYPAE